MERILKSRHRVERQAQGLRDPDTMLEIWTSQRGTWAIVQRYANGRSCIVAFGEDWESLPPAPA